MTRALVLSGGGPVGIAWEFGIAAGLEEEGVRLADADFIIGTSAGSFVGAQLASGRTAKSLAEAIIAQSSAPSAAPSATPATRSGVSGPPNLTPLMELMARAADPSQSPEALRAEIGAFALNAETMSEEAFIRSMGRIAEEWPAKRFACTAVDALDGRFQVWHNDSGVPLASAVSSSCAVPGVYPPVTINGRRYIDGGMRSSTNADLARGYDHVLIVSVRSASAASGPMAELSQRRLENEINAIREAGGEVEIIEPDDTSSTTLGMNLMDARNRGVAVETGLRQGRLEAEWLRPFWV